MKTYVTFIIQSFIWSGYVLVVWISAKDRVEFKLMLFVIFFYLAYILAKKMNQSNRRAVLITLTSMSFHLFIYFQLKVF